MRVTFMSHLMSTRLQVERRTDWTGSADQKRLIRPDVSSIAGVHANTQRLDAGTCHKV